jgi:hypothetical protein
MTISADTLTITYTVWSTTPNTKKTRRKRRVCDRSVTGRSQCDSPRGSGFLDTEASKRTTNRSDGSADANKSEDVKREEKGSDGVQ